MPIKGLKHIFNGSDRKARGGKPGAESQGRKARGGKPGAESQGRKARGVAPGFNKTPRWG